MNVFVLIADYDYDGEEFIGVFQSNELAQQQKEMLIEENKISNPEMYRIIEALVRSETAKNLYR